MRIMRGLGKVPGWMQGSVLAIVILVSLPWAVQIWGEVDRKLDELRSSATDNVIWNLTQLEVEFLKYETAIQVAMEGSPQDTKALKELRRRFNNYFNRLETLYDGILYQEAFQHYRTLDMLSKLRTEIRSVEPYFDADDATLYQHLPDILKTTENRQRDVRRIITKGNQFVGVEGQARRDEISRLLWQLSIVVLVLLGALGLAAGLFFRHSVVNRRRAGEHKRSSVRYSTVISTSPDALIVTDGQGIIVEFNRRAEELFRIERSHALGKGFIRYLLDRDGQLAALPLTRSERVAGVELTLQAADGSKIPVEVSQGVAELETQRFYVYFLRDISDRKAADRALMSSRDRALSGERAKSRFLAVMSHEMRTPLNGILGLVELLRGNETTEDERERYLSLLRSSGQVLLDHVNDVLDIAQLEADGVRLNPAPFDLDQLMHDLIGPLELAAQARGVAFDYAPSRDILGCHIGDAARLRQVLVNLIGNAVKFTDEGGVTVSVSVNPVKMGHSNRLEFQIADTGAGIAEQDVARIFDDFVRLDRDGQHFAEGTGLGLGITKRIIEAMGGRIGVDSLEGEGSSFWVVVTLPVCAREAMTDADFPAAETESAIGETVRPMKILVVEDNATNRLVAREMLERDGHLVTEAINGKVAVEIAATEVFDVILMDINMPVMGGVEACQLIRKSGKNTGSRIVALTAHVFSRDDEQYEQAGLDAVLSKPLERGDLRRILAGRSRGTKMDAKGDPLFDRPHLQQVLKALGPQKAQKLRKGFADEVEALLKRLELAEPMTLIPDQALSTEVHSIAGSCAMVGAQRLRLRLNMFESELLQLQNSGISHVANLDHWRKVLRQVWEETQAGLQALQEEVEG